jgi:hypothetical protein
MVTPSAWHEDAYKYNEPGHDELQMAVYNWLDNREFGGLRLRDDEESPRLTRQRVVFEFPMIRAARRGRNGSAEKLVGFVDVAELFGYETDSDFDRAVLFEIKPEIRTIGGIVRQCLAYQLGFREAFPNKACKVFAVVPFKDPKLAALRSVVPCLAWNTETYELEGNRFG